MMDLSPISIPGQLASIGSFVGQREANQANAKQAEAQMRFQERMSGSAHQREVADLRKAGLNPILSATGGSGASTPNGAKAEMESALGAGVNTAMDAIRLSKELRGMDSQVDLNKAQATAAAAGAQKDLTTARNVDLNSKVIETTLPATAAEAKTRQGQARQDAYFQNFDNIQRRINNGLTTGNNAKDLFIPRGARTNPELTPTPKKVPYEMQGPRNDVPW